jgi:hypothetical protein
VLSRAGERLVVYRCSSFTGSRTWDGIDVNAHRAAEEVSGAHTVQKTQSGRTQDHDSGGEEAEDRGSHNVTVTWGAVLRPTVGGQRDRAARGGGIQYHEVQRGE